MTALWGRDAIGKIFISHSSLDKPFVRRRIVTPLNAAGYDTWLDERELLPGDPLSRKVSQGIKNAKVLLVVISAASMASNWLNYELNVAAELMIKGALRLIPVVIDDVQLPPELEGRLYVDMRKGVRGGLKKITDALKHEESRYPRPPVPASVVSESSYVRGRAYEKLLADEADGKSFDAYMPVSATRSVDWSGITLLDVDVRVDVVHSYINEVRFASDDFDEWMSQLEETSSSFGILIVEGGLATELYSKLDERIPGVWLHAIEAGLLNESGACIVVEVSVGNSADYIESRLRGAAQLMGECIANRKSSLWDELRVGRDPSE
ncbi:toll/interleukin-1 receptor domain-containing protein [Streptomyces sp. NPDC001759]